MRTDSGFRRSTRRRAVRRRDRSAGEGPGGAHREPAVARRGARAVSQAPVRAADARRAGSAALGIGGSALFARSLTAPIGRPRRRDTSGRRRAASTCRCDVQRTDEIGDLAAIVQEDDRRAARTRRHAEVHVALDRGDDPERPAGRAPEGERRTVTLLFCDIRGFTAFAEPRAPEEAVGVSEPLPAGSQADSRAAVPRRRRQVHRRRRVRALHRSPTWRSTRSAAPSKSSGRSHAATAAIPILPPLDGRHRHRHRRGHRRQHRQRRPSRLHRDRICREPERAAVCRADAHEILLSERTFELVRRSDCRRTGRADDVKGFTTPVHAYRMIVRPQDAIARHLSVYAAGRVWLAELVEVRRLQDRRFVEVISGARSASARDNDLDRTRATARSESAVTR